MQEQVHTTPTFQRVYAQLNAAQRRAVESIDGPVMVLAGPGTGKTQVLATRVAQILQKTDARPENILALTFTESAAVNMRERLVSMVGKHAYSVHITTFHAFCAGVITENPDYFQLPRESQPLADLERFRILEEILNALPLEVLKPRRSPFFYLKDLQKALSDLKREGIGVAAFSEIVAAETAQLAQERDSLSKTECSKREKALVKQRELAEIYAAYQAALVSRSRFDYDDMISLVATAFQEHEELLLQYQEAIHYFLVDEYQDTNAAQNSIVDLLASFWAPAANVFVVGDPNQAIYRFQGASLENVRGFLKRYPTAQVIALDTGYRCTNSIYEMSASLIAHNQVGFVSENQGSAEFTRALTVAAALQSVHTGGEKPVLYAAPSQTLETIFVAEQVRKLLDSGVPPHEIAVLYRNNSDSTQIAETLEKWGVPFEIDGSVHVLESECIDQFLTLCQVVHALRTRSEDARLFRVLQFEWLGVPALIAMQVARAASHGSLTIAELVAQGYEGFSTHHVGAPVLPEEFEKLKRAVDQLLDWGILDSRVVFTEWLETVAQESGYFDWILQRPQKVEELNLVHSLFREVRSLVKQNHNLHLAEFLDTIATMRAHGLQITVEDLNISRQSVHLSTVHKAKGREWQYVFVIHLTDGKWGNGRKRELIPLPSGILQNTDLSKKERNEDDRRLFYVALTRAKLQVTLSYPRTVVAENRSKEVVGSMFVTEISDHLEPPDVSVVSEVESDAETHLARLIRPPAVRTVTPTEQEYFSHLVSNLKLSVSALNSYLKDPDEFVLRHLLKVPDVGSVALAFGTSVHAALENLYKHYQDHGEFLELPRVQELFERALSRELLLTADFDRELEHGRVVLQLCHEHAQQEPVNPLFVERFFGHGISRPVLKDIPLVGRIDRIDWVNESEKTVRLIDYKTGKSKSQGDILATTKTASARLSEREQALPESVRGPLKRQLLFYKLLTELDQSFELNAVTGVFEFVEPDARTQKILRRQFDLHPEEVRDLEELIQEVMSEIRGLAFLSG